MVIGTCLGVCLAAGAFWTTAKCHVKQEIPMYPDYRPCISGTVQVAKAASPVINVLKREASGFVACMMRRTLLEHFI
jgi:hypothetical protein